MTHKPWNGQCKLWPWKGLGGMPWRVRLSEGLDLDTRAADELRNFIGWAVLGWHGGPGWRYWLKVWALMLMAASLVLWWLTGHFAPLVFGRWLLHLAVLHL